MNTKTFLSDYDLHERYDELLDEICPTTKIAGREDQTSRALKEMDPVAYRCGFNDWLDAQVKDGVLIETDNDEYYLA